MAGAGTESLAKRGARSWRGWKAAAKAVGVYPPIFSVGVSRCNPLSSGPSRPRLRQCREQCLVQELIAQSALERLDEAVPHWLARREEYRSLVIAITTGREDGVRAAGSVRYGQFGIPASSRSVWGATSANHLCACKGRGSRYSFFDEAHVSGTLWASCDVHKIRLGWPVVDRVRRF